MLITNDRPVSWYFIYKTIGGIPKRILLSPGQEIEIPEISSEEQIVFKAYDRKAREINNRLERGIPERTINPDRKVFVDKLRGIDSYINLSRFLSDIITFTSSDGSIAVNLGKGGIGNAIKQNTIKSLYSKTTRLAIGTTLFVKDEEFGTNNFYRLGENFTILDEETNKNKEVNSWILANSLSETPSPDSEIYIFSRNNLIRYQIDFETGKIIDITTKENNPKTPIINHISSEGGSYIIYIANPGLQNISTPMQINIDVNSGNSLFLDSYTVDGSSTVSNINLFPSARRGSFDFVGTLNKDGVKVGTLSVTAAFDDFNVWSANNVELEGNFYDIKIQYSVPKNRG